MKKFAVTLTSEALDSSHTIDAVKENLALQGARNIELHGMGIITLEADGDLNFAVVQGIENFQEVVITDTEPDDYEKLLEKF